MLPVHVTPLDPDLPLPTYAHPGDAGLDLRARESGVLAPAGGRMLMPTGIAIAIPPGHAGFVLPRSGNALKHGVTVANAPGLIDAAYRGEIKVVLLNTDPTEPFHVHRGDRIAQLVVQRVEEVQWQVVESLDGDDRGGGFGHTGTH
jgi:dUTP pyrophosphatase